MGRPEKLRNYFFFLLLLLLQRQVVTAGPFEQGMTSLEEGDFAEAYCIWRPMAMRGHAEAAYHMGWLYANGNGLKVDIQEAIHWWSQAANQGHTEAQFALGLTYTNGEGIDADPEKALDWYMKAAKAGHQDAREMVRSKVREGTAEVQGRLPELVSEPWLGQPIRVIAERANLRSGPGTSFSSLGMVKQNMILMSIGQRDGWAQVIRSENGRQFSWIAGWLTEPVED